VNGPLRLNDNDFVATTLLQFLNYIMHANIHRTSLQSKNFENQSHGRLTPFTLKSSQEYPKRHDAIEEREHANSQYELHLWVSRFMHTI
jgi:hypothetical protein